MVDEDLKTLLRMYVALIMAREVAGAQGSAGTVSRPLAAAANYNGVAIRELESLLDRVLPAAGGVPGPPEGQIEFAAMLM